MTIIVASTVIAAHVIAWGFKDGFVSNHCTAILCYAHILCKVELTTCYAYVLFDEKDKG